MADPVSAMMIVSMGASAASAGLGAYGAIEGAEAKAKAYQYQAGIADVNAKIAKQNAEHAFGVGEQQAQRSGMASRFTQGRIQAAQGASGIAMNAGTHSKVQEGQALVGRMDQATIRDAARRKAYGHMVEAESATQSGVLARMSADDALDAGAIGATQSILGGVSSVSSKWIQGQQMGMIAAPTRHPYDAALDHLYT